MEQRSNANDAPVKDARTEHRREEYARGMEQQGQRKSVAVKDAIAKPPRQEDCVLSMEQRLNDAALKDALAISQEEECARDMEQRSNDASKKDALVKLGKEEYDRHRAK